MSPPATLEWVAVLSALALLPFVLIMMTAFVKIVVVLGILRSALGFQAVPPTQVIVGLAFILTGFIMAPVGLSMYERASEALDEAAPEVAGPTSPDEPTAGPLPWERLSMAAGAAIEPLRGFLAEHAHPRDTALFVELSRSETRPARDRDDLLVLVPSFVISELKEAFQIGFLLFIPFLVLDLVVANVLLSLGMHMLSPTTVSLPFKLLLFVLVDGWLLLAEGLVAGYQLG